MFKVTSRFCSDAKYRHSYFDRAPQGDSAMSHLLGCGTCFSSLGLSTSGSSFLFPLFSFHSEIIQKNGIFKYAIKKLGMGSL